MSLAMKVASEVISSAPETESFGSDPNGDHLTAAYQKIQDDGFDILSGWSPEPNTILTRTRAISARVNQNFDGFPSQELKRAYKTFLGKPVFVNHHNEDPDRARGRVVAARYVEAGDDKYIEVIQEVDANRFPKLAKELREGGLDAVSMGTQAGRTICSYCGYEADNAFDVCDHIVAFKGQYLTRTAENGMPEDVLVYEECRDLSFFELSYVFDPADETALVSSVITANQKVGFGETEAPELVNTLREDDEQEEDDYHRYVEPPTFLSDPDLDAAGHAERDEEEPDISEFLPFERKDGDSLDSEEENEFLDEADAGDDFTDDDEDEDTLDPRKKSSWRLSDDEFGRTARYRGSIDAEVLDDYGAFSARVAHKDGTEFFDSFGSFDEAMKAASRAVCYELETK